MTNSVSKSLLALAVLGACASSNANAIDCGSTTTSSGALTVNQTECISGNGLYYYVDVENNNTALEIKTSGGTGEADIFVNTSSWATRSSYHQSTNNAGTEETLAVTANAGRLYVSIFGIHQGVTLDVLGNTGGGTNPDTGGGTTPNMCGANTLSGYVLTLASQECISGNGQYFYIDIEADNTPLIIETKNGSGQADIFVNTGNWATRSSNIASSQSDGTDETLKITANAGRLYISVFGLNNEVSFKVSLDDG
ncbi:MAG: PPC domain-containing protein, partial [Colwellia sp.]|nr:PPC domain-containing protein [Colwellia sp.]